MVEVLCSLTRTSPRMKQTSRVGDDGDDEEMMVVSNKAMGPTRACTFFTFIHNGLDGSRSLLPLFSLVTLPARPVRRCTHHPIPTPPLIPPHQH